MSQWVDANGDQWRFSTVSGSWLRLVSGSWMPAVLPPGGLRKVREPSNYVPDVVIVETMGPRGPIGLTGPPGPGFNGVAEVITQEQDGVATTFLLSNAPDLTQAVQVFRNGLLEMPGYSYSVTATSVTFTTPPLSNDVLTVVYQKAQ